MLSSIILASLFKKNLEIYYNIYIFKKMIFSNILNKDQKFDRIIVCDPYTVVTQKLNQVLFLSKIVR
ncbi:MAG: hypothetical protein ACI8RD_010752, partial [Bacillariaceae sp.]